MICINSKSFRKSKFTHLLQSLSRYFIAQSSLVHTKHDKKMHICVEEKFSQEHQGLPYPEIKIKETKTLPKILSPIVGSCHFLPEA